MSGIWIPDPDAQADAETIEDLVANGADLARPVLTDHVIEQLTEDSARGIAAELESRGYTNVRVEPPFEEEGGWGVIASRELLLSAKSIAAVRAELSGLAERGGGYYDGWAAQGST